MSTESEFEFVCHELEVATDLDRLEARGTVRIALKAAGLEAKTVTVQQFFVVLKQIMPAELNNVGIADTVTVCHALAEKLQKASWDSPTSESPESIFERIGGRA